MPRQNGRDLRIKDSESNVVAVANTKTITIANNPVDVTGDDDAGFVTLLDRVSTKQLTMDISGFSTNEVFRDQALGVSSAHALLDSYTIEFLSSTGDGSVAYTISGDFFLTNFSETGASDGGLEFTANLVSSGSFAKVTA